VVPPALLVPSIFCLSPDCLTGSGTIGIADLAVTLVGCDDRRSDVAGVASRGVRGQSATAAA
jgi:hypothetical protein